MGGVHHDRNSGVALGEVGQDIQAVAVRQAQVQKNQLQIRIPLDLLHRLARVRRLHHDD